MEAQCDDRFRIGCIQARHGHTSLRCRLALIACVLIERSTREPREASLTLTLRCDSRREIAPRETRALYGAPVERVSPRQEEEGGKDSQVYPFADTPRWGGSGGSSIDELDGSGITNPLSRGPPMGTARPHDSALPQMQWDPAPCPVRPGAGHLRISPASCLPPLHPHEGIEPGAPSGGHDRSSLGTFLRNPLRTEDPPLPRQRCSALSSAANPMRPAGRRSESA